MITFTACGQIQSQNKTNNSIAFNTKMKMDVVAPLFIHGDGLGSFGCVSVAPHVFFSEEEAFQIIQEESKKYRLEFKKDEITIEDIEIPVTDLYPYFNDREKNESTNLMDTKKGKLQLDGVDEKLILVLNFFQ